MAVSNLQILDIIEVMEAFVERRRPPEHIRSKLDIAYKLEGQSVIIHEIRPSYVDPSKTIYPEVAKATFVKAKNYWKVFWRRADLKWHAYAPNHTVNTLAEFTKVVELDKHGCFWG